MCGALDHRGETRAGITRRDQVVMRMGLSWGCGGRNLWSELGLGEGDVDQRRLAPHPLALRWQSAWLCMRREGCMVCGCRGPTSPWRGRAWWTTPCLSSSCTGWAQGSGALPDLRWGICPTCAHSAIVRRRLRVGALPAREAFPCFGGGRRRRMSWCLVGCGPRGLHLAKQHVRPHCDGRRGEARSPSSRDSGGAVVRGGRQPGGQVLLAVMPRTTAALPTTHSVRQYGPNAVLGGWRCEAGKASRGTHPLRTSC
jgi:hypothetical protein